MPAQVVCSEETLRPFAATQLKRKLKSIEQTKGKKKSVLGPRKYKNSRSRAYELMKVGSINGSNKLLSVYCK